MNLLHLRIYPGQDIWQSQWLGTILVTASPLFGGLPLAMIVGNFLVWLLPPARRILDHEAEAFPSTSYRNSQTNSSKSLVLVPVSLLLSLVGALLPWHW